MPFLQKSPNWYKKYHKSFLSEILNWCFLVLSLFILFFGFKNIAFFASASKVTSVITQEILSGVIGISIPSFVSFTPIESNISFAQTSTAVLKGLSVSDERGIGGIEWTVTASCTDFYAINQPVKLKGSNDTLTSSGIYDNSKGGTYTITIVKPGGVGTSEFDVSGLEKDYDVVTGKNVGIGTNGVVVNFAPTNYNVGDSWNIRVDTIPISNLTIFPQYLSSKGSLQGISLGERHAFIDRNDNATILIADLNHNPGTFFLNLNFILNVPPFTYSNNYSATLTITTD